jgi:hypothetical protein
LEREKVVDSEGRIVEMDDDPMLGEAGPSNGPGSHFAQEDHDHGRSSGYGHHTELRPDN